MFRPSWKHKTIKYLLPTLFLSAIILHVLYSPASTWRVKPSAKRKEKPYDDTSCHLLPGEDDVTSSDSVKFPEKSIYFIESSCYSKLNSRQACSIESAARVNPEWKINVIFVGPISGKTILEEPYYTLKTMKNVQFLRLNLTTVVEQTPLELFLLQNKDQYRILDSSNVQRILTLYKYGGIYLDLDVLVVKSFNSLPKNFLVSDYSDTKISSYIIGLSKDEVGRNIADVCLRLLKNRFETNARNWDDPEVLYLSLWQRCDTSNVKEMSATTCEGMNVLKQKDFSPLQHFSSTLYFAPNFGKPKIHDVYVYHLWNHITKYKKKIAKDSLYAGLAKELCPRIYNLYGEDFGILTD